MLGSLAGTQPIAGAEVIALGQHVDYWDQLGWKDRFSSPALTERQRAYARAFSSADIYTPQMVVDGRAEIVGSDARAAGRAIADAASRPHAAVSMAIDVSRGDRVGVSVTVADLPAIPHGESADIVVAVVEDGLSSQVRAGENKGRVLTHAAVVRALTPIGEATPAHAAARTDVTIPPAWQREQVRIVAFVQERASRRVLGAVATPLAGAHR